MSVVVGFSDVLLPSACGVAGFDLLNPSEVDAEEIANGPVAERFRSQLLDGGLSNAGDFGRRFTDDLQEFAGLPSPLNRVANGMQRRYGITVPGGRLLPHGLKCRGWALGMETVESIAISRDRALQLACRARALRNRRTKAIVVGITRYPQPVRHPHTARITCGHRVYGLSCEDLNALYERAGHACEICRKPERPYVLNIDHEPFLGDYAVRGLLCGGCNGALGAAHPLLAVEANPNVARYLTNPWWARPGGPRPLNRACFAMGEHDRWTHVIGRPGIRKIGKLPDRTRCGQELYRATGLQLYQVQDSKICIPCAERDPIEIERLDYYRRHPSAFAL